MRVDSTAFHFAGHEQIVQENKLFKETNPKLAEQSVSVSISKEGYESYRSSVKENGQSLSYDQIIEQRKMLADVKMDSDTNFSFRLSQEANRLNESNTEALTDGKNLSWQAKAKNYAEAYINLYDEIVQGYENSTRKITVLDENSEMGYRTLTMEEELSALDAAYEKNVEGFEEYAAQQNKAQAIIGEWKEQVVKIKSGSSPAQSVETQTKQSDKQEKLTDNFVQKMLSIRDSWKAAYPKSGKDAAWKSVVSLFSTMFR